MAVLHPFKALRPDPEIAREVACVPYDVINAAEARALAKGKLHSFLHVIRPEIDFPEGVDEHADEVYRKGADNLAAYAKGAHAVIEEEPRVYAYRLIMNGRPQVGIFGCVAVSDYDTDVILKHELTRPSKEDDRTRHILEQSAHAEPVMLTFRDTATITRVLDETMQTEPLYDLTAEDGVQHTIWSVDQTSALVDAFAEVPTLYVADGHHRCKAASRAAAERPDKPEAGFFPAVLFPISNMEILAYNRIVRSLPDGKDAFMATLRDRFDVKPTRNPVPSGKGAVCVYTGDGWAEVTLPTVPGGASVVDHLDVGRLSSAILEPMLGISDPRTDPNIDFVGGIRGTGELERLVDGGQAELAISMAATSIEELVDVSDAGLLMPPKSTWFEPKLRSGLLVHLF